jgi:copper chaperone NosL
VTPSLFLFLRRALRVSPLVAALLFLAACASNGGDELEPPEILYGQDMCESCGMLIDDPRFAAATLTADGQSHKFDDMNEMFLFHQENPEIEVTAWFVHHYDSEEWLRAEGAFFVHSSEILSPMAGGLAAFATRAEADALATELGAEALSFDEAREAVQDTMQDMNGGH